VRLKHCSNCFGTIKVNKSFFGKLEYDDITSKKNVSTKCFVCFISDSVYSLENP
jgi:hypothetical protein